MADRDFSLIELEIKRVSGNLLSYYEASAAEINKSCKIYKVVSALTTALAAGIIFLSSYSAFGFGILDRTASVSAAVCGILITALQIVWSRSRYSQHSSVHRSICSEARKARNRINKKLILLNYEPDGDKKLKELEELSGYAHSIDTLVHDLKLTLAVIPATIEGFDEAPKGAAPAS